MVCCPGARCPFGVCRRGGDAATPERSRLRAHRPSAAIAGPFARMGASGHPSLPSSSSSAADGAVASSDAPSPRPRTMSFQQNMLREHPHNHDVMENYEELETIGEGSISTISRVRKRNVGGSARLSEEERRRRNRTAGATTIMSVFVGGIEFLRKGPLKTQRRCNKRRRRRPQGVAGEDDTGRSSAGGPPDEAPPSLPQSRLQSQSPRHLVYGSVSAPSSSESEGWSKRVERHFALKRIDLRLVKKETLLELQNEVEIFKHLDHPNIAKAYETYCYNRQLCVVMELCTGGDLHTRAPYTEREASNIVGKLLSAVVYMHKKNVMHRDLKYENILFENRQPNADIKLIDFGLSKKYLSPDHVMTERVGTVYTMAPEVVRGTYTFKADLWSVGVIAYMLLSNTKPFWGKKKKRIVEKIMKGRYNFLGREWSLISREARFFVRALIQVDPQKRLTAEEAQSHPWLTHAYKLSDRRPAEHVIDRVNENIIRYADSGEFKKVALNIIAHKSTAEEIFQFRAVFDQYDRNNDGAISYDGFKEALSKFKYSEEEQDAMFRSVDFNENGVIFYTEFLAAAIEAQGRIEEERLAEAFDRIDSDDTGYISKENLRQILGTKCTDDYAERLISEVDTDNDGKVSYEEFLSLFLNQKNKEIRDIYDADMRSEESTSSHHTGTFEDGVDDLQSSEEQPLVLR